MKRNVCFFLLLGTLFLNAHPPKSLDLRYDAENASLTVKVWHKVNDPQSHYIGKIVVFQDDEPIAQKTYKRQVTDLYQEEIFILSDKPLKKNDRVKVQAACNRFGKKTAQLEWRE